MSTVDWMTQIGRLNYFAGELASRHHVAAEEACDTVRQLANILESMVYNGDGYLSSLSLAAPSWGAAPEIASLPVHSYTNEGGDVAGSSPYGESEPLLPQPAVSLSPSVRHASIGSYSSRATQNTYRFAKPYTFDAPPPDTVARNKTTTDHVIVLRDLSTPNQTSADHRTRRINPCLPVRFCDFVLPEYTFSSGVMASVSDTALAPSSLPGDAFHCARPYKFDAPPPATVDCNIHRSDQVVVRRDSSMPSHASADHPARHIDFCLPGRFSGFVPRLFTPGTADTASDLRTSAPPPSQSRYALRSRG